MGSKRISPLVCDFQLSAVTTKKHWQARKRVQYGGSPVIEYTRIHWKSAFSLVFNVYFTTGLFFINLAGTPPTKIQGSTFFVITAPEATTAPSPIITPGNIVTLLPIYAQSFMQTLLPTPAKIGLFISCSIVYILTSAAIFTLFPIYNPNRPSKKPSFPTIELCPIWTPHGLKNLHLQ